MLGLEASVLELGTAEEVGMPPTPKCRDLNVSAPP